jgi:cysteinyl-tRNA synthetase
LLHQHLADAIRLSKVAVGFGLRALGATLGVLQQSPQTYMQGGHGSGDAEGANEAAIQTAIAARAQAKANRDFAEADRIRKVLMEQGVVLKDSASGTTWVRA